jgi:hypothetical protein
VAEATEIGDQKRSRLLRSDWLAVPLATGTGVVL